MTSLLPSPALRRRGIASPLVALAVGLLGGAVLGLSPSCGAAGCLETCDGCCDALGQCRSVPLNRSSSSCGLRGTACVDCVSRGELCDVSTLTCVSGRDAGVSLCGCSLPSGACAAGTSAANCGADGGACRGCLTGERCVAGSCVEGSAKVVVGSPCSVSADCQTWLGPQAVCRRATSTGSAVYVDGYCTLPCAGGGVCPAGSSCLAFDAQYGEPEALCWDTCFPTGGDPCRSPGYKCYALADAGTHGCWLSPLPPLDGGPPADKVGDPCDAGADCQGPPDRGGVCLGMEVDRHWSGGYCSTDSCTHDAQCASDGGAVCGSLDDGPPRCLARCGSTPDAGARDAGGTGCRVGYRCLPASRVDGGVVAGGVCAPSLAPPPERTGAPCETREDCLAPTDTVAACLPEQRVGSDGGEEPTGFPGGLCTRLGCRGDDDCAADGGGVCRSLALGEPSVPRCFQACSIAAPGCRAGYVCRPARADGGDLGACEPRCDVPGGGCPAGTGCDAGDGVCH